MNPVKADFSPVRLRYIAAMRGVKPPEPQSPFVYAHMAGCDPDALACLAACNPEGHFFGVLPDEKIAAEAQRGAAFLNVDNITFISGSFSQLLDRLPMLDFMAVESADKRHAIADRATLFAMAEQKLITGGLFSYSFRAYDEPDDILRFLIRELTPNMNADQKLEFLAELKNLGASYFSEHSDAAEVLDKAIASRQPEEFFAPYMSGGSAVSGTIETMEGLLPRGFAFAGDAEFSENYLDMSAPAGARAVLEDCGGHLLYEPLKDFALNRLTRGDVWCRMPVEQTNDAAQLFGGFTFGITTPREQVPARVETRGNVIDLSQPLFVKLIDLMTQLPTGIGDFLGHPSGKGATPAEVLSAVLTLVGVGLARPMRGRYGGHEDAKRDHPKLAAGYNENMGKHAITSGKVHLASTVVGAPVALSARDALVMQAIDRVGLADSVSALLVELTRVSGTPALAAQIMDVAEPSDEIARNMINDVLSSSLVRWYAYGLLAA